MKKSILYVLIGVLRLFSAQETELSSEDDNKEYNYEYDISDEHVTATFGSMPDMNLTTSFDVTTELTTVDDYYEFDETPDHSEKEKNRTMQKWETWSENQAVEQTLYEWDYYAHRNLWEHQVRVMCHIMSQTYRSANKDLRRYYKVRTLYEHNVEYEIGYVTQEIIFRYSQVLEMFHQVQRLFHNRPKTKFAPTKYVFIMYANVLEQCKHIIHLCSMMNEIEKRYIAKPLESVFKDPKKVPANETEKQRGIQKTANEKQKILELKRQKKLEELKRKKKDQKKKRKNYFKLWQMSTTSKKRPKYPWPLVYGWSIEDW